MKNEVIRTYSVKTSREDAGNVNRDKNSKEAALAKAAIQKKKRAEKILIMLGLAFMEAIGIFTLICGIFSTDIETIGGIASLGYVIGIGGMIFAFMLLFQTRGKKQNLRERHS